MIELYYVLFLPIIAGLVLLLFPERIILIKGIVTVIISAVMLYFSFSIFSGSEVFVQLNLSSLPSINNYFTFNIDNLSKMIILFISFFGFFISIYSLSYIKKGRIRGYYSNFLITLGASTCAVLADNFLFFIFFWGVLALTLYLLIRGHDEESSAAAKKTFILIGASDSLIILGIAILWLLTGSFQISSIRIEANDTLSIVAFIMLLIGALTKAGAFPVHTWVPDYAKSAPASSSAFLPASLDKLLGIYFLARICMNVFVLNDWMKLLLLIIGSVTIIAAVMMALVQRNYKKLLGYHAVSQVGYMVTGIGLGTPLGIAGGLFHMINHALYKSGLFLTAGSIEKSTGKENLDQVSGLAKAMPLTFIAVLVCAFSISGIPPFNGFASKWMIYQGIIDFGNSGSGIASKLWVVWLTLTVFGSALTLASFLKFISGIFLGRKMREFKNLKEVSPLMWIPQIVIALVCVTFGVFALKFAIPKFIAPITGSFSIIGAWESQVVSALILISVVVGVIIYLLGSKKFRVEDSFIGGEKAQDEMHFSVMDFFKTVTSLKPLSFFFSRAERRCFDIYELFKKLVLGLNAPLSRCHSGILPTYTLWVIGGLIIMTLYLFMV